MDGLIAWAKAEGHAVLYPERYPAEDHYALFVEDPDRIKVEVVAS